MSNDPAASSTSSPETSPALPDPFVKFSQFDRFRAAVEPLATEYWTARQPLQQALASIEHGWDCDANCAARCLAVGAELRKVGLAAFPAEMANAVKLNDVPTPEQVATQAAWCLLAAATADDADRMNVVLLNLTTRPNVSAELPNVLAVVVDTCLAMWRCEASPPFTERLKAELDRHNLTASAAMDWMHTNNTALTPGGRSALRDWLYSLWNGRPIAMCDPPDSWGPEVPGLQVRQWLQPNPVAQERQERKFRELRGLARQIQAGYDQACELLTPIVNVPLPAQPEPEKTANQNQEQAFAGGTTTSAAKKTKGKNIDARMLKVLTDNRLACDWTSEQWAQHLDCAESTVRESNTWKKQLKKVRAMYAVDSAKRLDRSRLVSNTRPNRVTDDDQHDEDSED